MVCSIWSKITELLIWVLERSFNCRNRSRQLFFSDHHDVNPRFPRDLSLSVFVDHSDTLSALLASLKYLVIEHANILIQIEVGL